MRRVQVVLARNKKEPSKYAALKVVFMQSPQVVDDPDHLAIMKQCGPAPHTAACNALWCCQAVPRRLHTILATMIAPSQHTAACPARKVAHVVCCNQGPRMHRWSECKASTKRGSVRAGHLCTCSPCARGFERLLRREAKLLMMLDHPAVVECYDVIDDGQQMVIVMVRT